MNCKSLPIIMTLLAISSSFASKAHAAAVSSNPILRGGYRQTVARMKSIPGTSSLSETNPINDMVVNRLVMVGTCGNGTVGDGVCLNGDCCSAYGYCGTSQEYCGNNTCGNGVFGNGRCAQAGLCCSQYGYCGSTPVYCSNTSASSSNSTLNISGGTNHGDQTGKTIGIVLGVVVLLVIGFVSYRNRHRFQRKNVRNVTESNNNQSGLDTNSNTSNSNPSGYSPEVIVRSDPPATNSVSQFVFHEDQTIVSGLTMPSELEPHHHQGDYGARKPEPDDTSYGLLQLPPRYGGCSTRFLSGDSSLDHHVQETSFNNIRDDGAKQKSRPCPTYGDEFSMRSGFTDDGDDGMVRPVPALSSRQSATAEDIEARSNDDDDDSLERNRRHQHLKQPAKNLNHDDDDDDDADGDEFSLPSSYSEMEDICVARNLSSMPSPLLSPPKRCNSPPIPIAASNDQSKDHRGTSPISAPTIPVIDRSVAGRDDERIY